MILFIDDEPHRLREYEEALCEEGFKVTWATDAEEGMKTFLAHQSKIDVIILDVMMPPPAVWGDAMTDFGMRTGLKLLERIREETECIPVMVLTNLSLSSVDLPPYDLVELRTKMETPAFALPKLVKRLMEARRTHIMKNDHKDKSESRVVFQGPVHAQQLYVGDQGRQTMEGTQWNSKEELLGSFFAEIEGDISKRDMTDRERQTALDELSRVRAALSAEEPDRAEVAGAVSRFTRVAPWAKKKMAELITGASGSILGTAVVAGFKFALGIS